MNSQLLPMNGNTFTLVRRCHAPLQRGLMLLLLSQVGVCGAFAQKATVSDAAVPADVIAPKVAIPVKVSEPLKQSRRTMLREALQTQTVGETPKPAASTAHHLNSDQRAKLREELRQQHNAMQMERDARTKQVCTKPKECQEEP